MRTKIKVGDFLCVQGSGYDYVDVLVINSGVHFNKIRVDEIFTRDLIDRVRWDYVPHDYIEIINDKPYQELLYKKLMNKEYGKEYQKFFRREKLIKINEL